jgi:hypothetical protein
MTTTYDLPLPGDTVDGHTVVASTYLTDDTATLILLNDMPPFFTVAEVSIPVASIYAEQEFHNIVYAVREYEQRGGDV